MKTISYIVIFIIIILLGVLFIRTPELHLTNASDLWTLVQDWRVQNNLKPYTQTNELCAIAQDRANDGFDWHKGFFEKYGSQSAYFKNSQIRFIAENELSGILTNLASLNAWLNSPEHLANLKADYTYSCLRCNGGACVQDFANY